MHKTIISDTSCLILLDKIGELEILKKLFGIINSVKPILSKIKATDFRITEQLESLILKRSGE